MVVQSSAFAVCLCSGVCVCVFFTSAVFESPLLFFAGGNDGIECGTPQNFSVCSTDCTQSAVASFSKTVVVVFSFPGHI